MTYSLFYNLRIYCGLQVIFFHLILRQLGAIVFTLIPPKLQRVTAETCRFFHFLSLQKRVRNSELKTKGWRQMKVTQAKTTTTKKMV